MSLPVVFRAEAETEFDDAFDFYNSQRTGLGDRFIDAVQATLDRICLSPHLYPSVARNARKAVVNDFPYCVYYRTYSDRIEIISILHSKRNPETWRRRL